LALDSFSTVCTNSSEHIMNSLEFRLSSLKARAAGAVFGLVCSFASLAAVFLAFASATGELDPVLARLKAAPSASEVAAKPPPRPVPG
jgi:hypothetical protein